MKHKAEDVHHINQQCDANHAELITTLDSGIFNKNKLWNLVSLCKECHQGIHASPAKIIVSGYVQSSQGIELKWSFNNSNNSPTEPSSVFGT